GRTHGAGRSRYPVTTGDHARLPGHRTRQPTPDGRRGRESAVRALPTPEPERACPSAGPGGIGGRSTRPTGEFLGGVRRACRRLPATGWAAGDGAAERTGPCPLRPRRARVPAQPLPSRPLRAVPVCAVPPPRPGRAVAARRRLRAARPHLRGGAPRRSRRRRRRALGASVPCLGRRGLGG